MTRVSTTGIIDQLNRLVQEIAAGLAALHRVQFDEPWKAADPTAHAR